MTETNQSTFDQVVSRRNMRLARGAISAIFSKGAILLANALAIPITIRYLGAESFGVWTTISTMLTMLLVLDFGVANSLTNFISEAYAHDDRERASRYSTTAFLLMIVFALILACIGCLLWPLLNWKVLFHLSSHSPSSALVGNAVAGAFVVFLFGLPASLAPKILGGYQELRSASLFQAIGSVCNLLLLTLCVHLHAGLVALTTASSVALVGSNYLCLLWIWLFHKPWLSPRTVHVTRVAARKVMQTGSQFFVVQIAALVVFNSDNLIIAHYLGPTEVASYSVAWRLVNYASIAQTLVAPSLWPAFSEAFARNDLSWVRKTYNRTLGITLGISVVFSLVFLFSGRRIIAVWAGQGAIPSQNLIGLMCIWTLISTWMNNISILLTASGETKLQAWCSIGAAIVNLGLSIYWVQRLGSAGVILSTIVAYVFLMIAPMFWKVNQLLSRPSA